MIYRLFTNACYRADTVLLSSSGVLVGSFSQNYAIEVPKRNPRRSFLFKVQCTNEDGETVVVRVRNVSSTGLGAIAETGLGFIDGETVKLHFKDMRAVRGEIMWTKGKEFGVTFSRTVELEKIFPHLNGLGSTFVVSERHQIEDRCWRPAPTLSKDVG